MPHLLFKRPGFGGNLDRSGASCRPHVDAIVEPQIDVTDVHNATVILSGDNAAIQLGEDQFLPRLDSYLQMASALRDQVPDIDSVDLRFDDRIYVRPTPKSKRRK